MVVFIFLEEELNSISIIQEERKGKEQKKKS